MNLNGLVFPSGRAVDPVHETARANDLMGTLVEYVVAHEVGHTLGFQHNMKASSTYPQEKMRDRAWVKKMGHTPTLMDYSRFNYVAQPEDKIDVADLVPGIGPYDEWATMWGYKPLPRLPVRCEKTLRHLHVKGQTPWLRFSTAASEQRPGRVARSGCRRRRLSQRRWHK